MIIYCRTKTLKRARGVKFHGRADSCLLSKCRVKICVFNIICLVLLFVPLVITILELGETSIRYAVYLNPNSSKVNVCMYVCMYVQCMYVSSVFVLLKFF